MANAGFQSFRDDGLIQIDGDYDQYCLIKSGYLTNASFTGNVGGGGQFANPYAQIIASWPDAIIALRSTDASSRCAVWNTQGTSRINVHKWWNLSITTPVEYYIFTRYRPGPSNYGFQIFNEQAQLTFDAQWPLMKIVDVVPINPNDYPAIGEDAFKTYVFNNPQLAKIACCLAVPTLAAISRQGMNQILSTCVWLPSINQVTVSFVRTMFDDTGPSVTGFFNESSNLLLMFDVTNLPIPFN